MNPDNYIAHGGLAQKNYASPVKDTALTRLQEAVDRIRVADSNCASLAYSLVGDEPMAGAENSLKAVPYSGDGMLGEVSKLANELTEIAIRLESNIGRVQSRL